MPGWIVGRMGLGTGTGAAGAAEMTGAAQAGGLGGGVGSQPALSVSTMATPDRPSPGPARRKTTLPELHRFHTSATQPHSSEEASRRSNARDSMPESRGTMNATFCPALPPPAKFAGRRQAENRNHNSRDLHELSPHLNGGCVRRGYCGSRFSCDKGECMPAASLQSPPEGAPPRKRFTVQEVEQMLDAGLFAGQRFELIDGDLIDKMGQNPSHAQAIRLVHRWLAKILDPGRIQMQLPIQAGWTRPEVESARARSRGSLRAEG